MCGETCAQLTDRASGITEVGMGDTPQVIFYCFNFKMNLVNSDLRLFLGSYW